MKQSLASPPSLSNVPGNAPGKSLQILLAGLAQVDACHERDIQGLSLDSRHVKANDLFLAVSGKTYDGRDYIDAAVRNGAIAVVRDKTAPVPHLHSRPRPQAQSQLQSQLDGDPHAARHRAPVPNFEVADLSAHIGAIAARFFEHPSARMRVLGITGTNGKTTCAYLLAQALNRLGQRCALMGTIGNGFVGALQPATLTTADALSTQRTLAKLLAERATAVCVEVSSHGLQQGRVKQVAFDIAVLTNLSHDHLDYHGDMARYERAKQRLFEFDGLHCAVLNADAPFGRRLLRKHRAARCVSYGLQGGAVRARNLQINAHGIAFEVAYRGRVERICSPLLGAVNVPNLLASIAALLACGYDLGQIAAHADAWQAPPGRMELLRATPSQPQPAVVIDYAHTPAALASALGSLTEFCQGALWVVFGCGGDRDRDKRPQMGAVAESLADHVIVTDDNPRSEDPQRIAAQIVSGMQSRATVIHARQLAIETAIGQAAREDIVLVAGKGHESTKTIGARVLACKDRDLALAALQRKAMKNKARGS